MPAPDAVVAQPSQYSPPQRLERVGTRLHALADSLETALVERMRAGSDTKLVNDVLTQVQLAISDLAAAPPPDAVHPLPHR